MSLDKKKSYLLHHWRTYQTIHNKGFQKNIRNGTGRPGGPMGPIGPAGPEIPCRKRPILNTALWKYKRFRKFILGFYSCMCVNMFPYSVSFKSCSSLWTWQPSVSLLSLFSWRSNESDETRMTLKRAACLLNTSVMNILLHNQQRQPEFNECTGHVKSLPQLCSKH